MRPDETRNQQSDHSGHKRETEAGVTIRGMQDILELSYHGWKDTEMPYKGQSINMCIMESLVLN